MKINLTKKNKSNPKNKTKWKLVNIWDINDSIEIWVKSNQSPEDVALEELGYRLVPENK
jgi:hypothetical protein